MSDYIPISGSLKLMLEGRELPAEYTGHFNVTAQNGKDAIGFVGALVVLGTEMPFRTTILCDLPRNADGALDATVTPQNVGTLIEQSLIQRFAAQG